MTANDASSLKERQAWYWKPTQKVDLSERKRTVPMQVLNLGMMRTGTMSLQRALDMLGIPCYHGVVLLTRPSDVPLWCDALDAKYFDKGEKQYGRDDWDRLLGEFGAVSDVPVIAFVEDLVKAYPEAKVILTERDDERWMRSFEGVIKACWDRTSHRIADFDPWFFGPSRDLMKRWMAGWFEAGSEEEMRGKAVAKYHDHNDLVRRVTPPERLLEYELGSGWGPLCEFLQKPVPDAPFPHANDGDSLGELVGLIVRKGAINAAMRLLAVAAVPIIAVGLYYILYRQ